MLICPQCQFENPDTNKFCQQCGTSLTHKPCPECDTQVAYGAKQCPKCGTFTGTVWRAIIHQSKITTQSDLISSPLSGKLDKESLNPPPNVSDPEKPTDGETEPVKTLALNQEEHLPEIQVSWEEELANQTADNTTPQWKEAYLDPQQRYLLLQPLKEEIVAEIEVRVLDLKPLQASPIEALIERQSKDWAEQGTDNNQIINLWQIVPEIAKAYLALKSEFEPLVPKLHDAWVNDGKEVVLIEDRSQWPTLIDLWRDHQIPEIHQLQIFHEMVALWIALEPWHCRQSLYDLKNLRVDEDQSLGILRLIVDPPNSNSDLPELSQLWQQLYYQSDRTLSGPIGGLINDLKQKTISDINDLRSRLQVVADELQSETTPSPSTSTTELANNQIISPPSVVASTIKEPMNSYSLINPEVGDDMPTVVLPMQLLSLEDTGRTDVGRQRRHNEDYFGIQTKLTKLENPLGRTMEARGLYILCDGMGGHASGEIASALAVKTLVEYFETHWQEELPDEDCIRKGVLEANQAIYDINQKDARSGSGRMGTTLVMVLIQETEVAVAHVGDSRLYRLSRRQGMDQVTVDHEVGQREIRRGVDPEIAYSRPDAYQLTQALGPRNEHFVEPDVEFFELNEDTLLLLCSDGLSDNDLIEIHWQSHLQPFLSSRSNLEQAVNDLIELANQYNGHDNITAILIRAKVRPDLDQARLGNG